MKTSVAEARTASTAGSRLTERIASLLPGFTDIVTELHGHFCLVAASHECTVATPAACVTDSKLRVKGLEPHQIAAGWNAMNSQQQAMADLLSTHTCSFYQVDIPALINSKPSVLLTHLKPAATELDPSEDELISALKTILPGLAVVSANPTSLSEIYSLYHKIAYVTHSPEKAVSCVAAARLELNNVGRTVTRKLGSRRRRPRVAVVQWTDPLYIAGDWVPSVVSISAQQDERVKPGLPSVPVQPSSLHGNDIIIFALCGLPMSACECIVKKCYTTNLDLPRLSDSRYIISDATLLFSRPSLVNVVNTAKAVAEIVMDNSEYGLKGKMWREWTWG
ncbi:hypothetical protein BWQ96_02055 [Gracilariopsis chorda]|uniref:Fe/B12 periplasmic-binding domain-containing protein n=1 Tax=Gracilariopsis chorda TaxID=448386 RepID=A0A2V3J1B6_9FLOR|nr:hypothetical protein BWQ96_02055 [Gracilariopsis chorda]|eukprot:PXF48103.1 hypothetical protein BWQ96_02055 [Gracilariopsis chorda]